MTNQTANQPAVMQVYQSVNYAMFQPIDGNRTILQHHLKRLKKSMEENFLVSPILVNEKMEIIDGQHRFEAAKSLGFPIYFFIVQGYGLSEVQRLNQNSKNWTAEDFMHTFIDLGNQNYITYKAFKDKYNLGHHECQAWLLGRIGHGADITTIFNSGNFIISKEALQKASAFAEYICKIEKVYAGAKRRAFTKVIYALMQKQIFDGKYFLSQCEKHPAMLIDCNTGERYLELVETIYNYRKREKVNLRF